MERSGLTWWCRHSDLTTALFFNVSRRLFSGIDPTSYLQGHDAERIFQVPKNPQNRLVADRAIARFVA